ncbi:MAG: PorT family protein [Tannerella sp.]|jgi:hypothetical protein|nr:PorT family protein [Tannerella sp.]
MNVLIKNYIAILMALCGVFSVSAQERHTAKWVEIPSVSKKDYTHEWTIHLNGGVSELRYFHGEDEKKPTDIGVAGGLDYTIFFTRQWGITTGVEFALYNGTFSVPGNKNLQYKMTTNSGMPDDFYLNADIHDFKEKQHVTLLQIPFMARIQAPFSNRYFYFGAGLKAGIPIYSKWEQTYGSVTTYGHSAITGQWYENMPEMGFGTYSSLEAEGEFELDITYFLAFEAGLKLMLSSKSALYTSFYFDYALNNPFTVKDRRILEYNYKQPLPSEYKFNSWLESSVDAVPIKKWTAPLAVGVKIGIAFGAN